MSLLTQLEIATRELTEDALPHGKDIARIVAGLVAEVETPGALQKRATALVDAGIVDAETYAKHFVKTQVEVTPTEETAKEPEPEPEPPAVNIAW